MIMVQERKRTKETRLTPLGRLMISLFFIALTAVAGALIGYSIIGQGDPVDVFKPDTWIQLYDVVMNSLF